MATDKKASQINTLRTRGKTVTAEAVIDRKVVVRHLGAEPESLVHHGDVGTMGAYMAGANNNGAHLANGVTAMFIACGQDVANVAESSAGFVHSEITDSDDLYVSLTIPSLIVATYGGGTGLPTQRECLQMLGCHGSGKVEKFAEIVAGVCLAGELSLASAISASDWVTSHEALGRNR
jgi:hydroxymethylglutaryl-CoA reductase (NADPH)